MGQPEGTELSLLKAATALAARSLKHGSGVFKAGATVLYALNLASMASEIKLLPYNYFLSISFLMSLTFLLAALAAL